MLFVAWALASTFWSSDSSETWWNWVALAGIAFLAIVIGHVRDTLQTVRALGDVLRVLLGASLVVEILSGILLDVPFRFLGVQGNIWGWFEGKYHAGRNHAATAITDDVPTFSIEEIEAELREEEAAGQRPHVPEVEEAAVQRAVEEE